MLLSFLSPCMWFLIHRATERNMNPADLGNAPVWRGRFQGLGFKLLRRAQRHSALKPTAHIDARLFSLFSPF